MLKRCPFRLHRPILWAVMLGIIAGCTLVLVNHYAQWLPSQRLALFFFGLLVVAIFSLLLLVGVIYRETFYPPQKYADQEVSRFEFACAMVTNLLCWGMGFSVMLVAILR